MNVCVCISLETLFNTKNILKIPLTFGLARACPKLILPVLLPAYLIILLPYGMSYLGLIL